MAVLDQIKGLIKNEGELTFLDDNGNEVSLATAQKKGMRVQVISKSGKSELYETLFGKKRIRVSDLNDLIQTTKDLLVYQADNTPGKKEEILKLLQKNFK